ncbi:MAG: DUF3267 domain-containing protein [Clostridia bacterium]|nr:DUF3267 domain-containing protein [Clostridia bacterium]
MNQSTKQAEWSLPEGYDLYRTIDLAKNQKENTIVSVLSLVLLAVVFALGFLIREDPGAAGEEYLPVMVAALAAFFVYIVLHEAAHGIFMWYFSKQKPHFGISLQYAYAGSKAYFRKIPYLIIALAPVVIWGVVFLAVALLTPGVWFWLFWFLLAGNFSGAAGDLYVFWQVSRMQPDILVQDDGVAMRVYAPFAQPEA